MQKLFIIIVILCFIVYIFKNIKYKQSKIQTKLNIKKEKQIQKQIQKQVQKQKTKELILFNQQKMETFATQNPNNNWKAEKILEEHKKILQDSINEIDTIMMSDTCVTGDDTHLTEDDKKNTIADYNYFTDYITIEKINSIDNDIDTNTDLYLDNLKKLNEYNRIVYIIETIENHKYWKELLIDFLSIAGSSPVNIPLLVQKLNGLPLNETTPTEFGYEQYSNGNEGEHETLNERNARRNVSDIENKARQYFIKNNQRWVGREEGEAVNYFELLKKKNTALYKNIDNFLLNKYSYRKTEINYKTFNLYNYHKIDQYFNNYTDSKDIKPFERKVDIIYEQNMKDNTFWDNLNFNVFIRKKDQSIVNYLPIGTPTNHEPYTILQIILYNYRHYLYEYRTLNAITLEYTLFTTIRNLTPPINKLQHFLKNDRIINNSLYEFKTYINNTTFKQFTKDKKQANEIVDKVSKEIEKKIEEETTKIKQNNVDNPVPTNNGMAVLMLVAGRETRTDVRGINDDDNDASAAAKIAYGFNSETGGFGGGASAGLQYYIGGDTSYVKKEISNKLGNNPAVNIAVGQAEGKVIGILNTAIKEYLEKSVTRYETWDKAAEAKKARKAKQAKVAKAAASAGLERQKLKAAELNAKATKAEAASKKAAKAANKKGAKTATKRAAKTAAIKATNARNAATLAKNALPVEKGLKESAELFAKKQAKAAKGAVGGLGKTVKTGVKDYLTKQKKGLQRMAGKKAAKKAAVTTAKKGGTTVAKVAAQRGARHAAKYAATKGALMAARGLGKLAGPIGWYYAYRDAADLANFLFGDDFINDEAILTEKEIFSDYWWTEQEGGQVGIMDWQSGGMKVLRDSILRNNLDTIVQYGIAGQYIIAYKLTELLLGKLGINLEDAENWPGLKQYATINPAFAAQLKGLIWAKGALDFLIDKKLENAKKVVEFLKVDEIGDYLADQIDVVGDAIESYQKATITRDFNSIHTHPLFIVTQKKVMKLLKKQIEIRYDLINKSKKKGTNKNIGYHMSIDTDPFYDKTPSRDGAWQDENTENFITCGNLFGNLGSNEGFDKKPTHGNIINYKDESIGRISELCWNALERARVNSDPTTISVPKELQSIIGKSQLDCKEWCKGSLDEDSNTPDAYGYTNQLCTNMGQEVLKTNLEKSPIRWNSTKNRYWYNVKPNLNIKDKKIIEGIDIKTPYKKCSSQNPVPTHLFDSENPEHKKRKDGPKCTEPFLHEQLRQKMQKGLERYNMFGFGGFALWPNPSPKDPYLSTSTNNQYDFGRVYHTIHGAHPSKITAYEQTDTTYEGPQNPGKCDEDCLLKRQTHVKKYINELRTSPNDFFNNYCIKKNEKCDKLITNRIHGGKCRILNDANGNGGKTCLWQSEFFGSGSGSDASHHPLNDFSQCIDPNKPLFRYTDVTTTRADFLALQTLNKNLQRKNLFKWMETTEYKTLIKERNNNNYQTSNNYLNCSFIESTEDDPYKHNVQNHRGQSQSSFDVGDPNFGKHIIRSGQLDRVEGSGVGAPHKRWGKSWYSGRINADTWSTRPGKNRIYMGGGGSVEQRKRHWPFSKGDKIDKFTSVPWFKVVASVYGKFDIDTQKCSPIDSNNLYFENPKGISGNAANDYEKRLYKTGENFLDELENIATDKITHPLVGANSRIMTTQKEQAFHNNTTYIDKQNIDRLYNFNNKCYNYHTMVFRLLKEILPELLLAHEYAKWCIQQVVKLKINKNPVNEIYDTDKYEAIFEECFNYIGYGNKISKPIISKKLTWLWDDSYPWGDHRPKVYNSERTEDFCKNFACLYEQRVAPLFRSHWFYNLQILTSDFNDVNGGKNIFKWTTEGGGGKGNNDTLSKEYNRPKTEGSGVGVELKVDFWKKDFKSGDKRVAGHNTANAKWFRSLHVNGKDLPDEYWDNPIDKRRPIKTAQTDVFNYQKIYYS